MLETIPAVAFALLSLGPMAWVWVRLLRDRLPLASPVRFSLALLIITLSATFFALTGFFPGLIGPNYSTRRYATLDINVAFTLFALFLTAKAKHPVLGSLLWAGSILAGLWMLIRVGSSVA